MHLFFNACQLFDLLILDTVSHSSNGGSLFKCRPIRGPFYWKTGFLRTPLWVVYILVGSSKYEPLQESSRLLSLT